MKTPEEQAKEQEEKNKSLIARTHKYPAKPKIFKTFKDIASEKAQIQAASNALFKREVDASNMLIEMLGLEVEDVEKFDLNEDTKEFIIVLKEKKQPTSEHAPESIVEAEEVEPIPVTEA